MSRFLQPRDQAVAGSKVAIVLAVDGYYQERRSDATDGEGRAILDGPLVVRGTLIGWARGFEFFHLRVAACQ